MVNFLNGKYNTKCVFNAELNYKFTPFDARPCWIACKLDKFNQK